MMRLAVVILVLVFSVDIAEASSGYKGSMLKVGGKNGKSATGYKGSMLKVGGKNGKSATIPSPEDQCISHLMQDYEKDAEPPLAEGETNVTVTLWLEIICVMPCGGSSSGNWIRAVGGAYWKDPRLSWEPEDFGGVHLVRINARRLWFPEIYLYDATYAAMGELDATVTNGGEVLCFPPLTYSVPCSDDDANDEISCSLKFVSHSSDMVDIREVKPGGFVSLLRYENTTCPTVVRSFTSARNVQYFPGVQRPFYNITANLQLAWRSTSNRPY